MKKTVPVLIILLLLILSFTISCKKEDTAAVSISGAFALYPLMVKWAEEYKSAEPGIPVNVSAGGAGKGMADVLGNLVDIGMISREIYAEEIAQGAWPVAVAKDAVVGVVNRENPALDQIMRQGLSKEKLKALWAGGKECTWGEITDTGITAPVHVYTRSDACGAATVWALLMGKKQEDLEGTGVFGDPGIVDAVRTDSLGIGYGNVNFVYDMNSRLPMEGIVPIPVDFNGDGGISDDENFYQDRSALTAAISRGSYPSPPSRILYLVCRGVPAKKPVRQFLLWILTDGQQYISGSGYIPLAEEFIRQQIEALKK